MIREVTRRVAKNTFLSAEDAENTKGVSNFLCAAAALQLIREVTRRVAKNTFLSAEDAENTKGESDFLCAAAPPFDDQA